MKSFIQILLAAALVGIVTGCAKDDEKAQDQAMRESVEQAKNFDINKVPEKDRERVRAFMQMGRNPGVSAPAGGPPPSGGGPAPSGGGAAPAPGGN